MQSLHCRILHLNQYRPIMRSMETERKHHVTNPTHRRFQCPL
nr:MAG TPA: hypothetical protein [Caudoviricetes sp.]